jgi:hypothetical protein
MWGLDDLVDAVSDGVSDIGSGIADAAEAVGSAAVDVAGNAGSYVGATIGGLGAAVDAATDGAASSVLNAVDDTVFDGVNYVTDGAVDINYDDGRFSASVGIPGVADVGASIGENGVTASSDTLLGSTDVGLTDQGLQFDSSGGIDWGPLPYYSGHTDVSPNGDVSVNGHVQGTVPTPYGILSGQATTSIESNQQGWGASLDADGSLLTDSGVTIGAGVQAGYAESGGNSQTTLGLEGSLSEPGLGTIGGGIGYQSTTKDGVTVTQEHAEGYASGFGVTASAGENYVGIDTPQGSASQFTTNAGLSGPTVDTLENLGSSLLGDTGLGGGDPTTGATTDAMTGATTDAMSGATTDAMSGATTAAMTGTTTDAMTGAMTGTAEPAGNGSNAAFGDDVLGTDPGSAAIGDAAGPAPMGGLGGDDILMGSPAAPTDADPNATAAFGNPDPQFGSSDSWSPAPDTGGSAPEPAAPEAAPPVDSFDQSVGAADQVQSDLDSMTDNLTSSGNGDA